MAVSSVFMKESVTASAGAPAKFWEELVQGLVSKKAEKIAALVKAANVKIDSYWPGLFAKLLEKNLEDLIMKNALIFLVECNILGYPALCVAYIDEVEESEGGKVQKVYYSVLVKVVDNHDQEIYRIKLPGSAKIGEGKPENQNHAVIFTRGEALQTIDMNQDNYLEEAFKMHNLLEELMKIMECVHLQF